MLKHLILASIVAYSAPAVSAQNSETFSTTRTITGMVVDKNGNPLSGAEVRATGGAETVYTEADGSYSIEVPVTLKSLTASYTGLRDRKLKTTSFNNMIFTLKPYNATHGFVNIVGTGVKVLGGEPKVGGMIPQLGIMGGAYRSWGGYAKIVMGGFGGPNFWDGYEECKFPAEPTVTGGVIKRITPRFNLLVGLGIGFNYNIYAYEHLNYGESSDDNYSYIHKYPEADLAIAAEVGFMYHIKKLNIIAGVTYISPCLSERNYYNESYNSVYKEMDNYNDGNLAIFVSVGLHI